MPVPLLIPLVSIETVDDEPIHLDKGTLLELVPRFGEGSLGHRSHGDHQSIQALEETVELDLETVLAEVEQKENDGWKREGALPDELVGGNAVALGELRGGQ
jgi:hypothetical protein